MSSLLTLNRCLLRDIHADLPYSRRAQVEKLVLLMLEFSLKIYCSLNANKHKHKKKQLQKQKQQRSNETLSQNCNPLIYFLRDRKTK